MASLRAPLIAAASAALLATSAGPVSAAEAGLGPNIVEPGTPGPRTHPGTVTARTVAPPVATTKTRTTTSPAGTTATPTTATTTTAPLPTSTTITIPATTTPATGAATGTATTPATARPAHSSGTSGTAIALAAIGAVLVLCAALWAFLRTRTSDPHWLLAMRHSFAEAGYRVSATWSEMGDWMRLGR